MTSTTSVSPPRRRYSSRVSPVDVRSPRTPPRSHRTSPAPYNTRTSPSRSRGVSPRRLRSPSPERPATLSTFTPFKRTQRTQERSPPPLRPNTGTVYSDSRTRAPMPPSTGMEAKQRTFSPIATESRRPATPQSVDVSWNPRNYDGPDVDGKSVPRSTRGTQLPSTVSTRYFLLKRTGTSERLGMVFDDDKVEGRITEVWPDSPAHRAGLQPGMTVVEIDGQTVPSIEALQRAVQTAGMEILVLASTKPPDPETLRRKAPSPVDCSDRWISPRRHRSPDALLSRSPPRSRSFAPVPRSFSTVLKTAQTDEDLQLQLEAANAQARSAQARLEELQEQERTSHRMVKELQESKLHLEADREVLQQQTLAAMERAHAAEAAADTLKAEVEALAAAVRDGQVALEDSMRGALVDDGDRRVTAQVVSTRGSWGAPLDKEDAERATRVISPVPNRDRASPFTTAVVSESGSADGGSIRRVASIDQPPERRTLPRDPRVDALKEDLEHVKQEMDALRRRGKDRSYSPPIQRKPSVPDIKVTSSDRSSDQAVRSPPRPRVDQKDQSSAADRELIKKLQEMLEKADQRARAAEEAARRSVESDRETIWDLQKKLDDAERRAKAAEEAVQKAPQELQDRLDDLTRKAAAAIECAEKRAEAAERRREEDMAELESQVARLKRELRELKEAEDAARRARQREEARRRLEEEEEKERQREAARRKAEEEAWKLEQERRRAEAERRRRQEEERRRREEEEEEEERRREEEEAERRRQERRKKWEEERKKEEERRKREEEEEEERLRQEEEERRRREAERKRRLEEERKKREEEEREEEERLRREEEEKEAERKRREEERQRRELDRQRREEEKRKREAEEEAERKRKEEEERRKKEAEKKRLEEERRKREAEEAERKRREAEEAERKRKEAEAEEERKKREAERRRKEEEERLRREEEERRRLEEEERKRREAEKKRKEEERKRREEEEQRLREEEERRRREEEERERQRLAEERERNLRKRAKECFATLQNMSGTSTLQIQHLPKLLQTTESWKILFRDLPNTDDHVNLSQWLEWVESIKIDRGIDEAENRLDWVEERINITSPSSPSSASPRKPTTRELKAEAKLVDRIRQKGRDPPPPLARYEQWGNPDA